MCACTPACACGARACACVRAWVCMPVHACVCAHVLKWAWYLCAVIRRMPYSRLDKMGDSASPLGCVLFWSDWNYISGIRPLFRSSNPPTIFTLNRCSKAYYFNEKCNTLKTKSAVQGMGCGVVNPRQPNAMFLLVRHELPSRISRVDYIVFYK